MLMGWSYIFPLTHKLGDTRCHSIRSNGIGLVFYPLDFQGEGVLLLPVFVRLPIRPSVCLSVHKLYLVHTITFHRFEVELPNLHQTCILGCSWLVLKMEVIDLDLQGHFVQAITWTNVDLLSVRSSGTHLKAISWEIPQQPFAKFSLKTTHMKLNWNLPGANELTHLSLMLHISLREKGQHWLLSLQHQTIT